MNRLEPAITLKDVTTGYAGKRHRVEITRGINADIFPSELTCLLGPNGAGKSTLLKTLSAFIPPLQGEITIDGRNLKDYSEARLARTIGVVLTEKIMLHNMTVHELVSLGRSPYTGFWGRSSQRDRDIVDEAMNMVGISAFGHRQIHTLSDGERQKVMIAKALAQETPIVFLDEPTAFLDYPSKVEIMQLLLRLAHEKNKTVFLSTHDLELALQIADKIWLVDRARGLRIGTPEDLSLSGEMGSFFEREGIAFDLESGLFRIDNRPVREIRIIGTGHRSSMAAKALGRIGIKACTVTDSADTVEITDRGFIVNGTLCASVEELIDAVRDITVINDKQ